MTSTPPSRWLAAVALLGLAACDQCPPPEPEGGSPRARAQVERAVADFYEGLGGNRICVTGIRLQEARAERAGHYSRTFRAVGVDHDTDLGPDRVATHELCHALDHQHGVRLQQDNLWTYADPRADLELSWEIMGEAFADTCEVGPLAIQLVGESCPDDTAGSRAWQVLQRWLPEPVPGHLRTELELVELGSWVTHAPIERIDATGMAGRVVRLDVDTGATVRTRTIDLDTGASVPLQLPSPLPPPPELPEGWELLDHAGTADRSVVRARLVAPNGGEVERLLHVEPHGALALGCPRPHEVPFHADGELWSAWAEGDVVFWGQWVDVSPPPGQGPKARDLDLH